jgi:ABC-type phosphate transport system permease subunit
MENTTESQTTATQQPATEGRKAYGTAKTENLRDSGFWRILLPAVIVAFCLVLIAFPLIILTPLFLNSLDPKAAANVLGKPLTWLWIVIVLIEAGIIVLVVRGLLKIFMTQAGNYR